MNQKWILSLYQKYYTLYKWRIFWGVVFFILFELVLILPQRGLYFSDPDHHSEDRNYYWTSINCKETFTIYVNSLVTLSLVSSFVPSRYKDCFEFYQFDVRTQEETLINPILLNITREFYEKSSILPYEWSERDKDNVVKFLDEKERGVALYFYLDKGIYEYTVYSKIKNNSNITVQLINDISENVVHELNKPNSLELDTIVSSEYVNMIPLQTMSHYPENHTIASTFSRLSTNIITLLLFTYSIVFYNINRVKSLVSYCHMPKWRWHGVNYMCLFLQIYTVLFSLILLAILFYGCNVGDWSIFTQGKSFLSIFISVFVMSLFHTTTNYAVNYLCCTTEKFTIALISGSIMNIVMALTSPPVSNVYPSDLSFPFHGSSLTLMHPFFYNYAVVYQLLRYGLVSSSAFSSLLSVPLLSPHMTIIKTSGVIILISSVLLAFFFFNVYAISAGKIFHGIKSLVVLLRKRRNGYASLSSLGECSTHRSSAITRRTSGLSDDELNSMSRASVAESSSTSVTSMSSSSSPSSPSLSRSSSSASEREFMKAENERRRVLLEVEGLHLGSRGISKNTPFLHNVSFRCKGGDVKTILASKKHELDVLRDAVVMDLSAKKGHAKGSVRLWDSLNDEYIEFLTENLSRLFSPFIYSKEMIIFPHLSVKDNLLIAIEMATDISYKTRVNQEKAKELLEAFSLNRYADETLEDLSDSWKAVYFVCCAFTSESPVILLDNVTEKVTDVKCLYHIWEGINRCRRRDKKKALLHFSVRSQDVLDINSTHVSILQKGQLLIHGTTDSVAQFLSNNSTQIIFRPHILGSKDSKLDGEVNNFSLTKQNSKPTTANMEDNLSENQSVSGTSSSRAILSSILSSPQKMEEASNMLVELLLSSRLDRPSLKEDCELMYNFLSPFITGISPNLKLYWNKDEDVLLLVSSDRNVPLHKMGYLLFNTQLSSIISILSVEKKNFTELLGRYLDDPVGHLHQNLLLFSHHTHTSSPTHEAQLVREIFRKLNTESVLSSGEDDASENKNELRTLKWETNMNNMLEERERRNKQERGSMARNFKLMEFYHNNKKPISTRFKRDLLRQSSFARLNRTSQERATMILPRTKTMDANDNLVLERDENLETGRDANKAVNKFQRKLLVRMSTLHEKEKTTPIPFIRGRNTEAIVDKSDGSLMQKRHSDVHVDYAKMYKGEENKENTDEEGDEKERLLVNFGEVKDLSEEIVDEDDLLVTKAKKKSKKIVNEAPKKYNIFFAMIFFLLLENVRERKKIIKVLFLPLFLTILLNIFFIGLTKLSDSNFFDDKIHPIIEGGSLDCNSSDPLALYLYCSSTLTPEEYRICSEDLPLLVMQTYASSSAKNKSKKPTPLKIILDGKYLLQKSLGNNEFQAVHDSGKTQSQMDDPYLPLQEDIVKESEPSLGTEITILNKRKGEDSVAIIAERPTLDKNTCPIQRTILDDKTTARKLSSNQESQTLHQSILTVLQNDEMERNLYRYFNKKYNFAPVTVEKETKEHLLHTLDISHHMNLSSEYNLYIGVSKDTISLSEGYVSSIQLTIGSSFLSRVYFGASDYFKILIRALYTPDEIEKDSRLKNIENDMDYLKTHIQDSYYFDEEARQDTLQLSGKIFNLSLAFLSTFILYFSSRNCDKDERRISSLVKKNMETYGDILKYWMSKSVVNGFFIILWSLCYYIICLIISFFLDSNKGFLFLSLIISVVHIMSLLPISFVLTLFVTSKHYKYFFTLYNIMGMLLVSEMVKIVEKGWSYLTFILYIHPSYFSQQSQAQMKKGNYKEGFLSLLKVIAFMKVWFIILVVIDTWLNWIESTFPKVLKEMQRFYEICGAHEASGISSAGAMLKEKHDAKSGLAMIVAKVLSHNSKKVKLYPIKVYQRIMHTLLAPLKLHFYWQLPHKWINNINTIAVKLSWNTAACLNANADTERSSSLSALSSSQQAEPFPSEDGDVPQDNDLCEGKVGKVSKCLGGINLNIKERSINEMKCSNMEEIKSLFLCLSGQKSFKQGIVITNSRGAQYCDTTRVYNLSNTPYETILYYTTVWKIFSRREKEKLKQEMPVISPELLQTRENEKKRLSWRQLFSKSHKVDDFMIYLYMYWYYGRERVHIHRKIVRYLNVFELGNVLHSQIGDLSERQQLLLNFAVHTLKKSGAMYIYAKGHDNVSDIIPLLRSIRRIHNNHDVSITYASPPIYSSFINPIFASDIKGNKEHQLYVMQNSRVTYKQMLKSYYRCNFSHTNGIYLKIMLIGLEEEYHHAYKTVAEMAKLLQFDGNDEKNDEKIFQVLQQWSNLDGSFLSEEKIKERQEVFISKKWKYQENAKKKELTVVNMDNYFYGRTLFQDYSHSYFSSDKSENIIYIDDLIQYWTFQNALEQLCSLVNTTFRSKMFSTVMLPPLKDYALHFALPPRLAQQSISSFIKKIATKALFRKSEIVVKPLDITVGLDLFPEAYAQNDAE